jgi:hypothetical protein
MRSALALVSSAAALSVALAASVARAEECPEGDWFCEPSESAEPPPGPAPGDDAEPESLPPPHRVHRPRGHRPHHVVFEPSPPPRRYGLRRPLHPWGFDAHVFGALLGSGRNKSHDASMGGLGLGLRYRLLPEFAIEGSLELGFGTDYNGYDRREAAGFLHALGTLNPRGRVRAYVFGGFGLSTAEVTSGTADNSPLWPRYDRHYSYFGVDLGAGVEVGLSPRTAIKADLLGFIRDRTDRRRDSQPEFEDPETGRTTNASGGALIRVGALFSW